MNKIFHAPNEKLQQTCTRLTNYQEICQCFFFQFVKKQSFIGSKLKKIGNCNHKKRSADDDLSTHPTPHKEKQGVCITLWPSPFTLIKKYLKAKEEEL